MEMKRTYVVQENGQVTLPAEWREKYGLKRGDLISFVETDEGLLVQPREAVAMELLDQIGEALKERGISLEELVESGREIRAEMLKEKYGLDAEDA
jgi:AbrB family looped-hinge helix DNA binding protein